MRTRTIPALLAAGALTIAACSDDDPIPNGNVDPSADDAPGGGDIDVPDGMTVTSDGFIIEEVQAGDDVATQLLIRLFGFADNIPADDRACMSGELAPLFPDGVVPADIEFTEDLAEAIDGAAEACNVTR